MRRSITACFLGLALGAGAGAEPAVAQRVTTDLTLEGLIQRILAHSDYLQQRLLEVEITRRKYRAERGIFEPELVVGYERQDNQRESTSQDFFSGRGQRQYQERNNIYNAGLESLVPTGGRLRLGYALRNFNNNQQFPPYVNPVFTNGEYVSFVGFSLVQPLLKGAGTVATMANTRLAAVTSEIAFQEYRRQLMILLSTAEASYWNLYLAQEQMLSLRQSVALAEGILKDNQARVDVGRGSELEVLEAQAGLAMRRSKQAEARQLFYEAVNRLQTLYAESSVLANTQVVVAVDVPTVDQTPLTFFAGWQSAFDWNPDYLIRSKQLVSENIRLAYAKNQRLPQLDLKASYGLNGLGDTPGSSWDDITHTGFPSWGVGVELRFPLGGGTKGRHELSAAKLKQKQALLSLKELEVQMANALDTSLQKARSARDDVQNYQTVVAFSENLLQTRLAQLEAGKVESRKVLEVEADLLEARISLVEARVRYKRALLELELLQGSLLNSLHLEVPQRELERHTATLVRQGEVTDLQYAHFLREVQMAYQGQLPGKERGIQDTTPATFPTMETVPKPPPSPQLDPEQLQRARDLLRQETGRDPTQ